MSTDGFSQDNSSNFDVEDSAIVEPNEKRSPRLIALILAVIVLVGGGFYLFSNSKSSDEAKVQGKVALTAQELRDVVLTKKLTVYWAGPQVGAKYALTSTGIGTAYVRYLPAGVGLNDSKTPLRAVGTYTQKNAFAVSQATGKTDGNVGFISADGDAVFYTKSRPTNVYIGIKGKDIQVEIFDPVVDQALGLVLIKGQVGQIK